MSDLDLKRIFENGHRVDTIVGKGKTYLHRAANIVLVSNTLSILENLPHINFEERGQNPFPVNIEPGTYPVFATLVIKKNKRKVLAYITIQFRKVNKVHWERIGEWFTDHGICILCDTSVAGLAHSTMQSLARSGKWDDQMMGILNGKDGNMMLDHPSGLNALVFRCADSEYPCYIGRNDANELAYFVIDCTRPQPKGFLSRLYHYLFTR